jgi:hypothetical protein
MCMVVGTFGDSLPVGVNCSWTQRDYAFPVTSVASIIQNIIQLFKNLILASILYKIMLENVYFKINIIIIE